MFNSTNLILNSDLALVSTQVKTLLYIVGQKARESSDTSMSTGHIPGHWKINKTLALYFYSQEDEVHVRIQRGDKGSGPPLENHKNIDFFSNTAPDPHKIVKLPSQLSNLGHNQHASETPFKWRFAGGPKRTR